MADHGRTVFREVRDIVSEDTGEVLTHREIDIKALIKTKDPFFSGFGTYNDVVLKLPGNEFKLLWFCATTCEFGTNRIILNKPRKEELMDMAEVSLSSVNNAIMGLVRKKVLKRIATATFILNPQVAWRGYANIRKKRKPLEDL